MPGAETPSPAALARRCRTAFRTLLRRLNELERAEEPSAAPRVREAVEDALQVLHAEYPETALDALLETPGWEHPAEVLARPRPTCAALYRAYQARTRGKTPRRGRLADVGERLERAARIAEEARRRRRENRELERALRADRGDLDDG